MITIPGNTFREVFTAISTHPDFDASERMAASKIAAKESLGSPWTAGREWKRFFANGLVFVVFPYTTGPSMNVGVEKAASRQT